MTERETLKLFEEKKVRAVWDDESQEWYFAVVDIIEVLTDSANPTDYLKKMRKRDPELGAFLGTNCPQLQMTGKTGKKRRTLAADTGQALRIIQSIPSRKAEPFKLWMAQTAATRLDQMQDPELSIEQAIRDYRRQGYSEGWINQRIKSIEIRKELTDEWARSGVQEGVQYASLTDIITQGWSGKTTREYKRHKGLRKESLRDNMTNVELMLNSLAEASAAEISRQENPCGFTESATVARKGARVAKVARDQLESQLGRSVISTAKAADHLPSPPRQIQDTDPEEA